MTSDVEMVSSAGKSAASPPTSRSPSPAHDTPSPLQPTLDLAPKPDPERRPSGMSLESLLNGDAKAAPLPPKSKKSTPTSSSTAAPKVAPNATGAKPKSAKPAPRSPSPSPPPPLRAPLQTVRLDIRLGGPEDYEVDISTLSKATGQRPPTPPPQAKRDTSDESHSEGDDEGDGPQEKKKKRKKKNLGQEYYDTTDPFIDDSELAQDERKFFAQTKQKGFYVSSGQVALMNKTPTKKPKSRKVNIMAPSATITNALSAIPLPPSLSTDSVAGPSALPEGPLNQSKSEDGTRESPIALVSDGEDDPQRGLKRKTSVSESIVNNLNGADPDGGSKKRRKTVEIHPFSAELERDLEQLRDAVSKENFEQKGKFPQNLKPLLAQVSLKAIILGEYDDNFFNLMPRLFPYNKFTMTKLIKRTVWRDHTALLVKRQNQLLDELKMLADEGFSKAKEEFERSLAMWEKRQERLKAGVDPDSGAALGEHSVEGTPNISDGQATPRPADPVLQLRPSIDENAMDAGMEPDEHDQTGGGGRSRDVHPPTKRYRLTDKMKEIIWQLVCLSNECCRIENEKNTLEGNNHVVSDQGVRKTLYQKIVAAFPDGWLSSGQISRDVSVMKKKYEKDSMDVEA